MPETSKRGRKPKLPDEERDKILKEIEGKVCLKEVTVYVKTTRGVEYSTAVWKILRKKKKVRYGKPYIQNSKPECRRNPKKRVDDCLSKVRNPVIGLMKVLFSSFRIREGL